MTVDTNVNDRPVQNSKVHRTNLQSSPSPPDPSTRPRIRRHVGHTLLLTGVVTALLKDPGLTTDNYNRLRRYSTHLVRGPGVHHERSSTFDSTIVGSQIRVGIRGSSSRVHGFQHLPRPLGVLGPDIRDRLSPILTRPVRTRVRGVTTVVRGQ